MKTCSKKERRSLAFKPILFLISLLVWSTAFAQGTLTVTGVVSDEADTLPGVSVTVQGTTIGTITDVDGKFTLNVPDERSVLHFSYVGYEVQKVTVGHTRNFIITLNSENQLLDEVVVIGYGAVRKKDLTGSTASVRGTEIAKIPVTTAAQAISGKVAGVNVVAQSGAPGADINITVRGGTSITQSVAPLYIVDGFQMDDGLRNIDINDIETIDVMKDASSTAIYGARGSNGVILITTKSGKEGKTVVNYNAYVSFEKLGRKLKLLGVEDYVKYQYEYQVLRGNERQFASYFGGDVTAADFYTGAYNRIANEYGNREGIDWQDEVFGGTAIMQNHNVSVSGGNAKTKFMINYNYTGQDGVLAKTGYEKNSIRAKINQEIYKGVRLDMNLNLNTSTIDGGGSLGGKLKMTILQPVTGGIRYTNDQMVNTDIREDMLIYDTQYDISNPIIDNDAVTQTKYTRQATANVGLEIDIPRIDGLTFRTAGSYFWQQVRDDYWDDGRTTAAKGKQGPYGYRNNREKMTWQVTNTLSYLKKIADVHNLNLMLGQETWYTKSIALNNEYLKFPDDNFGLNNTAMAGEVITKSGLAQQGIVSVFGRAMYNYNERYLFTAMLRGDGSSKFAKGNQWGLLPSASAAWRVSEEDFMKDVSFINNLKFRGGFGVTGNCNIDDNMYATDYEAGKYFIGSAEIPTLVPQAVLGNPGLVWEQTKSTSIGLDLSVLNNRINVTVDYYNNLSDNLLIKNSIAKSSGYTHQFQNIASIRNRGFEFIINTLNVKTQSGFMWTSDLNMSFNRSKVLSLYGEVGAYMKADVDSRIEFIVEEGKPLGQFYGYKYAGLYTTDDFTQNADGSYSLKNGVPRKNGLTEAQIADIKPGDIKFECIAGNTDADGNPVWSDDDRTVLGKAEPKFYGGFNNTFAYKGFDLSVFMNFSYGNKIFNMNTQRYVGPYYANQNAMAKMANRFTLIDPATGKESTDLTRLAQLNPNQHSSDAIWSLSGNNKEPATVEKTDYNLEDGSYLRISNITFGYTFPAKLVKKWYLTNARVYFTANNLYTFTKYSGYDPEVSYSSSDPSSTSTSALNGSSSASMLTRGVDNSAYPRARSFVVGVNLSF